MNMKNTKKIELKRIFKEYWIVIWIFFAAAFLFYTFTYAKFAEGQNVTKRVISAGTKNKVLFTSNYLKTGIPKYPASVAEGFVGTRSFDISIYNYDRTNSSSFYPTTINYTLSAVLKKSDGTAYSNPADTDTLNDIFGNDSDNVIKIYTVSNGIVSDTPIFTLGKNNLSDSENEQLIPDGTKGSASNTYRIVLPSCIKDKGVYVELKADPADGYSDLPSYIGGSFYMKTNSVNLTSGWKGEFIDNRTFIPSSYDGFNYSITGSGTATRELSWDKSLLTPNKQQIQELFGIDITNSANYTDNGNIRTIEVNLSSADNGGRYDIQFYVASPTARTTINSLGWNGVGGLVEKVTLSEE